MVIGYSSAFTGDGLVIGGTLERVVLQGMGMATISLFAAKTIPEAPFMIYQMTFALITVALVAGLVADRMRFSAFLWFVAGWLLFVYADCALRGAAGLSPAPVYSGSAGGTVVHLELWRRRARCPLHFGLRRGYGTEKTLRLYDLSLAVIGREPSMGGLAWFQRWLGAGVRFSCGLGDRRRSICLRRRALSPGCSGMVDRGKPHRCLA